MKRVIKERAFPGLDGGSEGMELRDWFAGQLIGVVMAHRLDGNNVYFGTWDRDWETHVL